MRADRRGRNFDCKQVTFQTVNVSRLDACCSDIEGSLRNVVFYNVEHGCFRVEADLCQIAPLFLKHCSGRHVRYQIVKCDRLCGLTSGNSERVHTRVSGSVRDRLDRNNLAFADKDR